MAHLFAVGCRTHRSVAMHGVRHSLRFPLGNSCRFRVSFTAVLERAENVLPCYAVVQQQLKPQVQEEPRLNEGGGWAHSLSWTLADGREIKFEKFGRTKKEARNEAARELLQKLASTEQNLDPSQNGALAQWAIEWINRRVDASMELQEELASQEQEGGEALEHDGATLRGPTVHVCTWSCPHVEGEFVARGSARGAAESRREAMAALYNDLPSKLDTLITSAQPTGASAPEQTKAQVIASGRDMRSGEMNKRHNAVVQKLGVKAGHSYEKLPSGEFECTVRWNYWDAAQMMSVGVEAQGVGRSKASAKARANEEMLVQQGHLPRLSDSFHDAILSLQQKLQQGMVGDAVSAAVSLMEDENIDVGIWSIFVPEVLRAALAESDNGQLGSLLSVAHRQLRDRGGAPVELWEGMLNEASFAMRHYYQASSTLESLRDMPLAENAFSNDKERDYFTRFRHLLALERHGGMLSGIHQYELDPNAFTKVPVLDVHHMEADMVVLTSTPESNIVELMDGGRGLKASDIVLMVPMEAVSDQTAPTNGLAFPSMEDDFMPRHTNWQHPEAWLGNVTSLKGNPQLGEEVRIHMRRISRFSSEVEKLDDGTQASISPITLGRQYQLFYIAMETPLARQLAAVRNLCRPQVPAWSESFERKPNYQYNDGLRHLLLGTPDEVRSSAEEPVRVPLGGRSSEQVLESIMSQRPWCAALTPSQKTALQRALEQRLSLIQGPPGTGKTHVACAIIAAWTDRHAPLGEKILAVADSNVAADNLHSRLKSFGIDSVRAGQGKDSTEYAMFGDELRRALQRAQIVIATCIGSGMELLSASDTIGSFQRVVIDECTQACEPAALVALGRMCEQAVLIGDHRQLPATVLSKLAQRDGLGVSLFERMVHNGVQPTVLQEQRRMHSSIAEWPNQAFYASQLLNAIDDADLSPVPGFRWPNPSCRVCFVDVSSTDGIEGKRGFSAFNAVEADALAGVLYDLLHAGVEPFEVGILTAYVAQRQEILRAIQARGLGHILPAITVDTVDGYQGMERDVVLFSATRSNAQRVLGFLADARRMNVMLTRARRGLIIFGNRETLQYGEAYDSQWGSWLDWADSKGAITTRAELLDSNTPAARSPDMEERSSAAAVSSPPVLETSRRDPGSTIDAFGADSASASMPSFATDPVADQLHGASSSDAVPRATQSDASAIPPPPTPPPAPAPAAWKKVYSEQYSAYYFWNQTTGTTQWEVPPDFSGR